MDDLWGSITQSGSPVPPSLLRSLSESFPQNLEKDGLSQEQVIMNMIPQVVQVVKWSDQLCESAWELAKYTPPNINVNPERAMLWKSVIIPKLVQSLVDNTRARNSLEESLSSIASLAVAINENTPLIRATQGSAKSIEVARIHIRKHLDIISSIIKDLQVFKSSALDLFKNHGSEILQIVGPQAAAFANQEAEQQDIIDKENEKIKSIIAERAATCLEVDKYDHLIRVVSSQIEVAESALQATRERTELINEMIRSGEEAIENIPETIERTTTTQSHCCCYWKTTTVYHSKINPEREDQVKYYKGIINSRIARLSTANRAANQQTQLKQTLEKNLGELKAKLRESQIKLDTINRSIGEDLKRGLQKINECVIKIQQICEEANRTENLIGIKGSTLLECLSAIRVFAKAEKNATCLWQPLISVLEYITSLTESSVQLLDGDKIDVFVGGVRLLKNVGFYHNSAAHLRLEVTPSEEYLNTIQQARVSGFLKNQ